MRFFFYFVLGFSLLVTSPSGVANPADPWEPLNRKIFVFNEHFDRWALKPAAKLYMWSTPKPVRKGVSNFFANSNNLLIAVNNLLQGKVIDAGEDVARFSINLTLGFLGTFDVASKLNLVQHSEDFGQTLGAWGVPSGPYVMLPFLGASTLRDASLKPLDNVFKPLWCVDHTETSRAFSALWILDLRVGLLSYEGLITGDPYVFIRDAFLQQRQFNVNDGIVEDEFLDDDF